jgi:hypothetical protein
MSCVKQKNYICNLELEERIKTMRSNMISREESHKKWLLKNPTYYIVR